MCRDVGCSCALRSDSNIRLLLYTAVGERLCAPRADGKLLYAAFIESFLSSFVTVSPTYNKDISLLLSFLSLLSLTSFSHFFPSSSPTPDRPIYLQGGSKRKETFWDALHGAWALLTQKIGSVRVDFAQPFSLQVCGCDYTMQLQYSHFELALLVFFTSSLPPSSSSSFAPSLPPSSLSSPLPPSLFPPSPPYLPLSSFPLLTSFPLSVPHRSTSLLPVSQNILS